jgi:signal transduction histidine kinase
MESLFWFLTNRTAETQFIYNLFHLLLAGLTLMVLLHQAWVTPRRLRNPGHRELTTGFALLLFHFALLTLRFGGEFFFQKELAWASWESLSHALLGGGLILVVCSLWRGGAVGGWNPTKWVRLSLVLVGMLALADMFLTTPKLSSSEGPHSSLLLLIDFVSLIAVILGLTAVWPVKSNGRLATLLGLGSVGFSFLLHFSPFVLNANFEILIWNAQQHSLSLAFFAFAWATGEHSQNLLDRVFVRLNLTFIILASLIMLTTVGMEKYQYLRLAEERSADLAEFLRGHISYYTGHGETLKQVFERPEVLRRVVVEFGKIPELREVNVYNDKEKATFRYTDEWEIQQEIIPIAGTAPAGFVPPFKNSFPMIRLPLETLDGASGRIEFIGTMDHINEYIGKYIILIYLLFTAVVGLATGIIGMIVKDADRRLRQQYAELQEAQEQLGQAAKLASVGQLAGGMAHEINNPITSILSLASHMAQDRNGGGDPERKQRNFKLIASQAKRVSHIVGNLLMFARQTKLQIAQAQPGELLETALSLVQYRLREGQVKLRKEFNGNLSPVLGDAGRLTEVFVNLLNNAIDAMPEGGTLTVRAMPFPDAPNGIQIEFQDSGVGIGPEDLPRIFDPFFTTKEPGKGTGLGLSISHGIIKDHGGEIYARSNPQRGTTLVITLPQGDNQ